MSISNKKRFYFLFVAGILLLAFAAFNNETGRTRLYNQAQAQKFREAFNERQQQLSVWMEKFISRADTTDIEFLFARFSARPTDDPQAGFYIYQNDSLVFWSHNHFPVPERFPAIISQPLNPVKLQNGWYQAITKRKGDLTFVVLGGIKFEYPHQNSYLKDHFANAYPLNASVKLTRDLTRADITIKEGGVAAMGLIFPDSKKLLVPDVTIILIFFLGLLSLVLSFYYLLLTSRRLSPSLGFILFAAFLLLFRYLMIRLNFPATLYGTNLFSPSLYATSNIFPSLGDFLLNAIVLLVLASTVTVQGVNHSKRAIRIVASVVAWGLMLFFTWYAAYHCRGLIQHSSISFLINNFFSLTTQSIAGIAALVVLLSAPVILALRLSTFIRDLNHRDLIAGWLMASVLYLLTTLTVGIDDVLLYCWPLALSAFLYLLSKGGSVISFAFVLVLLVIFSAFSAYLTNTYSLEKERKARILIAERLASENDPTAEYLFIDVAERIENDPSFDSVAEFAWRQPDEADQFLREKYFNGYWEKFEIRTTWCRPIDSLIINPGNLNMGCIAFFDSLISHHAQAIGDQPLYFIRILSGRVSYIARFDAGETTNPISVFVELHSKFIPEGSGYPELLLDEAEIRQNPDRLNYSFARYHDGNLVLSSGHSNYSTILPPFAKISDKSRIVETQGRDHLVYRSGDSDVIILSRKAHTTFDDVTAFSYFFSIYSLLTLAYLFSWQLRMGLRQWFNRFRTRIQLLFIGSIVLSILLFGAGTVFYIQKQYQTKNYNIVSEKLRSILIELEQKLGAEEELNTAGEEYLSFYLVKFSNVFFTDINLYDLDGNLLAASRPEIFNKGLISSKMDALSFHRLHHQKLTEFIHEEEIGKLKYLSAYVPFRNNDGKVLAYLNLPYFSKQNELENEISTFLVALINIYVLLLIVSITLALFISNYVTRPIQLIREKLRHVKLGRINEPINWKSGDELGNLIKEYNRMIQELTESAELLAKSERESAWREMAKQVAHEIKNPLTPMKLSIQHLHRAWDDKAPDFDQKIQRISATLIEQIDTLSSIATEFSNFAMMPKPVYEVVDLIAVLQNVADLHRDDGKVKVEFQTALNEALVIAGREQMLRAFNNLVKNAIQSIPEDQEGLVNIALELTGDDRYEVTVRDNGEGIAESVRERIFEPNFTTKSSGMGLGLAMVKNIVEMSQGEISFHTEEGKGTEFYILLPVYHPNNTLKHEL